MKKNMLLSCAVLLWIAVGCRTDDVPAALSDGQVEVRLTNGDSRTLLPTAADLYYTLVFTSEETEVNTSIEPGGELTKTVTLKPGTWNLSVNGYVDADDTEAAVVTGEASDIDAAAGAVVVVPIELTGTQSGSGVARFSLKFPQAAASATLTFTPYGGGTPVSANLLNDQTYAVSTDAGIVSSSGDITLSSGYYNALFLAKSVDERIVKLDTVHIFDGLSTPIEWAFEDSDFAEEPNKATLTGLLAEAGAAKAGIAVKADVTESSDVNVGTRWVTETDAAALEAVIAAAQGVVDDTSADLEAVLDAEAALTGAKTAYTTAIKEGTKPVDKTALATAITTGTNAKSGVAIGTAPEDVADGVVFVTQAVMATFDAAISAAQAVNDNGAVYQDAVDEAVSALNTAITTFNAAKQTGTNTGITAANKTELDAALTTANTAKDKVEVATAADKVLTGSKWVTAEEMNALTTAITNAASVSQDVSATQDAVDAAVTALNAAIATFNEAKKDGEKVPVTFSGLTANGSDSATTTVLTLTFDQDVPELAAEDIALSSIAATVEKGTLTKVTEQTGQYELGVTVTAGGSVTAKVAKDGFAFSPTQSVTVYYFTGSAISITVENPVDQTLTVQADKESVSRKQKETVTLTITTAYGTKWMVEGVEKSGTAIEGGSKLVIKAQDYTVGTHYAMVTVTIGGKEYSAEVAFTVTN